MILHLYVSYLHLRRLEVPNHLHAQHWFQPHKIGKKIAKNSLKVFGKHQPQTIITKTIEPKNPNAYVSRTKPVNQIPDSIYVWNLEPKPR